MASYGRSLLGNLLRITDSKPIRVDTLTWGIVYGESTETFCKCLMIIIDTPTSIELQSKDPTSKLQELFDQVHSRNSLKGELK